jgi:hypothetical protein
MGLSSASPVLAYNGVCRVMPCGSSWRQRYSNATMSQRVEEPRHDGQTTSHWIMHVWHVGYRLDDSLL